VPNKKTPPRKRPTYFEQVPLDVVKEIAKAAPVTAVTERVPKNLTIERTFTPRGSDNVQSRRPSKP